jgi:hypothetical protein
MRAAPLLLLLATAALAQEDVRQALDAQRYSDALALAEAALRAEPQDKLLLDQRAQALCGLARDLRRERGYVAAIDFLETRLDHPRLVSAYADCCMWGSEEERGLRGVRGAGVAAADRLAAEVRLLERLFRFEEAAALARAHGWKEAAEWAGAEAALRERFAARARRAGWAAAAGVAALLGAWALLRRGARSASAPATS